jgi:hypothetical protein
MRNISHLGPLWFGHGLHATPDVFNEGFLQIRRDRNGSKITGERRGGSTTVLNGSSTGQPGGKVYFYAGTR